MKGPLKRFLCFLVDQPFVTFRNNKSVCLQFLRNKASYVTERFVDIERNLDGALGALILMCKSSKPFSTYIFQEMFSGRKLNITVLNSQNELFGGAFLVLESSTSRSDYLKPLDAKNLLFTRKHCAHSS